MRIIIVFSSPNPDREEFNIWHSLIDDTSGYIPVNDSGDKIYAFDGKSLLEDDVWDTNELSRIISNIINNDNNDCEYVVMLHDRTIPETLIERFLGIRFKKYASSGSIFYDVYVRSFTNGNIQVCFSKLWDELHRETTSEENLKHLFTLCNAYSHSNKDMWKKKLIDVYTDNDKDTVYNELKGKGINGKNAYYQNIEHLLNCTIDNFSDEIVIAAHDSLKEILGLP